MTQVNTEAQKKYKDKIRKLLELSMSDNENEAQIALRQAGVNKSAVRSSGVF